MENKKICINDGELLVGERGPGPQATPTYPELCCHTLADLDVISERKKISFKVSEEVKNPAGRNYSLLDRTLDA
jgi:trans-4-hydroxy-L-proline dehydratase